MGSYLQTGFNSWNLAQIPQIGQFSGIVLSPVNDSPDKMLGQLNKLLDKQPGLDVILDPQLYNPAANKGQLPYWSYFGSDFETADQSDFRWWASRMPAIAGEAARVRATTVCSPAPLPDPHDDGYYRFVVDLADEMKEHAAPHNLDTAITLIVPLAQLRDPHRAMEIASTVSGSRCDRVFLSFLAPEGMGPRDPLRDQAALATAVHLIRLLSRQQRVHVACVSHDLLMWLGAGAHDVSTGKYMNLRRFTPSRWIDEPSSRKTIVSYWSDDQLLTLIRDRDVLLLDRRLDWFGDSLFPENPASQAILKHLREGSGNPWLGLSWVQYMRWFVNATVEVSGPEQALQALRNSHQAWQRVSEKGLLFTDHKNDGTHIVEWLNALHEGLDR